MASPPDGAGQRRLALPGGEDESPPLPWRLVAEPLGVRLAGRLPPL